MKSHLVFLGIHPPPGSYERWDIKRLEPKAPRSSEEKEGIAKSMLESGLSKPGTMGNSSSLNKNRKCFFCVCVNNFLSHENFSFLLIIFTAYFACDFEKLFEDCGILSLNLLLSNDIFIKLYYDMNK